MRFPHDFDDWMAIAIFCAIASVWIIGLEVYRDCQPPPSQPKLIGTLTRYAIDDPNRPEWMMNIFDEDMDMKTPDGRVKFERAK